MEVQGLVAFADLERHIVHLFRRLATEHGIRVLVRGNREAGAHAHDDARMHGVAFFDARGQVKATAGAVGGFQWLNEDSVADHDDILQGVYHAPNIRNLLTDHAFFAYIDCVKFVVIWTLVFGTIVLVLLRSPKARSWWRIFRYSRKVKILSIAVPLIILALSVTTILIPPAPKKTVDENTVFLEYSLGKVTDLLNKGDFVLGNDGLEKGVTPELVYILPAVLRIYHKEVVRATTPHLEQVKDTLGITFVGYRQFKNRGIRILKKLRKTLGKRYLVTLTSKGDRHLLQVVYLGSPWTAEQLTSLPVMEAAIAHEVDPALLMSLVKHVSDFQMNYEKDSKHKGLLALREGSGLEQVFIGARMLHEALDGGNAIEDVLVQFYPLNPPRSAPKEWHKDPLRRSWVEQVLGDIQFYRNNGLDLSSKDSKAGPKNRLPAILQPLVPVVGAQAASKIAELPPDSQAAILEEEALGAPDSVTIAGSEQEEALPSATADPTEPNAPGDIEAPAPEQPAAAPAPEKADTSEEPELIDLNKL